MDILEKLHFYVMHTKLCDKHLAALILLASFLRFCFHIKQIAKFHLTTAGNPSKVFMATNGF